jgi:hypothetical protein
MKTFISIFLLTGTIFLSGCFEITQELTVNKDGSGTISNTTDMSEMMSMAMQMAGDKAGEEKLNTDTLMLFKDLIDTAKDLTAEEKQLLKNGSLHLVMKMDENKYFINTNVPFSNMADVNRINKALQNRNTGRFMGNTMKELMNAGSDSTTSNAPEKEDPDMSMPEDYLLLTCKPGFISRVVNKEKIARLDQDEALSKMKEMSSMGTPLKTNFIINLPRPAKKVEGKNVKLSDDRKKVTISNELDELYNDPASFEFTIEY